jgi:hypothetical protein
MGKKGTVTFCDNFDNSLMSNIRFGAGVVGAGVVGAGVVGAGAASRCGSAAPPKYCGFFRLRGSTTLI